MDELKEIVNNLLKTEYISRRILPQVAHNTIISEFRQVFEQLGFKVILEQKQNYYKSKKKIKKGRIDIFATKENKSIALEYDTGFY